MIGHPLGCLCLHCQQYQNGLWQQQANYPIQWQNQLPLVQPYSRPMTASDLGIVDQNLDEKIGTESNPLDGTRLWDNS